MRTGMKQLCCSKRFSYQAINGHAHFEALLKLESVLVVKFQKRKCAHVSPSGRTKPAASGPQETVYRIRPNRISKRSMKGAPPGGCSIFKESYERRIRSKISKYPGLSQRCPHWTWVGREKQCPLKAAHVPTDVPTNGAIMCPLLRPLISH